MPSPIDARQAAAHTGFMDQHPSPSKPCEPGCGRLAWGILGTGRIAGQFAGALKHSHSGTLAAVGSRSADSAQRFGAAHGIPNQHASYEALLADPAVRAVYISTPHPFHARWAIAAAEAGRHILCEKPLALNAAEAVAVVDAARANGVFLMEAFMYRCHPQTRRLVELINGGAIGEVQLIEAAFSFRTGADPDSRLLNNALGGGGILDVGGYAMSMARLIAGAARGEPFAEPVELGGAGVVGGTSRVDEWAIASLKFPGGILAQLTTGVRMQAHNTVRIQGTLGRIEVPQPWVITRDGGTSRIILYPESGDKQIIEIHEPRPLYAVEADTVAEFISAGEAPAMSLDDTLGNMRALDRWRAALDFAYDSELPHNRHLPVHGRPLRADARAPRIPHGRIEGLDKPVSRLVMGVDNQRDGRMADVMFDAFYEHGGNVFDTAFQYLRGQAEAILGHWVHNRGVREQVVILDKGAHTPNCFPEKIGEQLEVSLERLQTGYVDIYLMHRDNPDVPVEEFVDALHEQQRLGRMRVYGGSNWSIERINAANAYAARRGIPGFGAISNQFSLARMVDPVWTGCISASDPASRRWFEESRTALLPWSSQARGFFTPRAHPDRRDDAELVRCWYADDNFERQRRARQLAAEKGIEPVGIALAYVLNQPFPTFPLIGPRTLDELRTSLPGLAIALTPAESAWLNLESDQREA
jgi:predicted dehydrogenase/predicted oxidoreductase